MIPFFDYRPEYRRHAGEIAAAVQRVFDSGRLILGPEVEAFESEFAAAMGAAGAVGVASGTDALVLAFRALEIGPGSEVLAPANAGVPPIAAIRATGATPVFVDVESDTLSIDPRAVAAAVGPKTGCVLAVHLYGAPAATDALLEITGRHGLPLVEDCAQAHGARLDGRPVGAQGALGCFSFYPTKNLGALGDGGAVVSDDPALLERIRLQRMYGYPAGQRQSVVEGLNSRLDELHAAILRVKLPHLASVNAERRDLAARYDARLAGSMLAPVPVRPAAEPVHHLYVVRTENRAAVMASLERHGIGYGLHYEHAVHRMPAYQGMGPAAGGLPVTEAACATVLSLPIYPGLPDEVYDRLDGVLEDLRS
jgi:dTDP-4-amino-4,6-dideoxygalactose transaminase